MDKTYVIAKVMYHFALRYKLAVLVSYYVFTVSKHVKVIETLQCINVGQTSSSLFQSCG
jgi:hypothetical protein